MDPLHQHASLVGGEIHRLGDLGRDRQAHDAQIGSAPGLTFGRAALYLGFRSGCQRQAEFLLLPSAQHGQFDRLANFGAASQVGDQVTEFLDRLAIHSHDDIAAHAHLLAFDLDLAVAATHASLVGRTIGGHVDYQGAALISCKPHRRGQVWDQRGATDAEPGLVIVAGFDQRRDHFLDDLRRDDKPDARARLHGRFEGGCHADDTPCIIHQHPTRVARVDRGVGLDDIRNAVILPLRRARFCWQRSPQGAYDAHGHRTLQSKGVADSDGQLADLDLRRVSHLYRL